MPLTTLMTQYRTFQLNPGIAGCTEDEVRDYELRLGVPLPIAYRQFLLWMGRNSGEVFLEAVVNYPQIIDLLSLALQVLQETAPQLHMPADAIVFWMNDEYDQFRFIRLSEGNNPPVYFYASTQAGNGFAQTHRSFSELIATELTPLFQRAAICRSFFEGDRNGLFPHTNLRPARELWDALQLGRRITPRPFTPDEIFALEDQLGFVTPPVYRELLLWLGDGQPIGFASQTRFPLWNMRLEAAKVSHALERPDPLPIDAFIFAPYGLTSFRYMRLSEGDNPPVYIMHGHSPQPERIAQTFSEYVLGLVQHKGSDIVSA